MLKVYLAGEIHTNWRDEIIDDCKKQILRRGVNCVGG